MLAEPVLCPSSYWFNDPEYVSTTANGHNYTFRFLLELGTTTPLFPGGGRYEFGYVVSEDLKATLAGVYMITTCNRIYVPIPPYAEPQPLLVIAETGWGYSYLTLNFTPSPEESEDCFGPLQNISPSELGNAETASMRDIDCTGSGGSGGGGDGGDEDVTVYCLYFEYYDEYGNFLYEELQFCWEQ